MIGFYSREKGPESRLEESGLKSQVRRVVRCRAISSSRRSIWGKKYGDRLGCPGLNLSVNRGENIRLPRTERSREKHHNPHDSFADQPEHRIGGTLRAPAPGKQGNGPRPRRRTCRTRRLLSLPLRPAQSGDHCRSERGGSPSLRSEKRWETVGLAGRAGDRVKFIFARHENRGSASPPRSSVRRSLSCSMNRRAGSIRTVSRRCGI